MPRFVWGPYGWVECDYTHKPQPLPKLSRFQHPDPQHWHNVRRDALERDQWRCVTCNSRDSLEVHHRTYQRWGREEAADVYTLCDCCHETFHALRKVG